MSEETISVGSDPDTFYVVAMTREHAPMEKPTLTSLCEYHYLQAASCLMIRRVLVIRSRVLDTEDGASESLECKFCS